mgnify:CR=1 FL=1
MKISGILLLVLSVTCLICGIYDYALFTFAISVLLWTRNSNEEETPKKEKSISKIIVFYDDNTYQELK